MRATTEQPAACVTGTFCQRFSWAGVIVHLFQEGMMLTVDEVLLLLTDMFLHSLDVFLECSVPLFLTLLFRLSDSSLRFFTALFVLSDLEVAFILSHAFVILDIGLSHFFFSQFACFHHGSLIGDLVDIATQTFPLVDFLVVAC